MEIIKGKQTTSQRVVIYGPEGIGKSTLASQFPAPVYIDVEGSTAQLDVMRTPKPSSWTAFKGQLKELREQGKEDFKTAVIDTIDWAEGLATAHVISNAANPKIKGIEDFGYGKGFTFVAEEVGKLLNYLNEMQADGWNIVLLAHAQLRKFEQPDEIGSYDRWELKLAKKSCALVKEWADAVLFCNYKTFVTDVEGRKKAQGGQRVIYTSHHPCWDAKNRWGLPEEIKMDFAEFAAAMPNPATDSPESEERAPADYEEKEREAIDNPEVTAPQPTGTKVPFDNPGGFPTKLWELMRQDGVSEEDVRKVVAARGYYPEATPIDRYDDDFVDGVLVSSWDKVVSMINQLKTA